MSPRVRFQNASQEDKARRAALYKKGQYRLLIQGRKVLGPVRLKGVTYDVNPEDCGASSDERIWIVELLWREEERAVGEYDLGVEVNEMEAIAWASR
jgi:hypothetical protein